MKRVVGNPLALAVLSYLVQEPMHPYQLARAILDHGDDRSIKFNIGSMYTVVRQLEKAGFISEQATIRDGARPERTVFAITDAGRAEVTDWLTELIEQPIREYPAFVSALSLVSALPPSRVLELLRRRLDYLAEQHDDSALVIDAAAADQVPALFLIEEEYRLALVDAECKFVHELIGRIADPATDWVKPWAEFHGETTPNTDGETK